MTNVSRIRGRLHFIKNSPSKQVIFFPLFFAYMVMPFGINTAAKADDSVTVQANQSVFTYYDYQTKEAGQSTRQRKFESMSNDFELGFQHRNYLIYLFPTAPGTAFRIGYGVNPSLELGVVIDFMLDHKDEDNKAKSEEFGIYSTYALSNGSMHLEPGFEILYLKNKFIVGDTSVDDNVGYTLGVACDFISPLAKNLSLVSGIGFSYSNIKLNTSQTVRQGQSYSLKVLGLRYDW